MDLGSYSATSTSYSDVNCQGCALTTKTAGVTLAPGAQAAVPTTGTKTVTQYRCLASPQPDENDKRDAAPASLVSSSQTCPYTTRTYKAPSGTATVYTTTAAPYTTTVDCHGCSTVVARPGAVALKRRAAFVPPGANFVVTNTVTAEGATTPTVYACSASA